MATPRSVRYLNEIRALNVLFRRGGTSRAELARVLGLNRSTTGNIVANLAADGLVVERRDAARSLAEARSGRPGIVVELDPDGATFLGAEIGVDRLCVVAMDMAAREIRRGSVAFAAGDATPEASIARLAELVRDVVAALRAPERIRGLCVTIPALLARGGIVRNALTLGWRDVPLEALLRRAVAIDVPLLIENDANAFAIAETYRGVSERADAVAFLLIHNGAGGGIVVGGRLMRGSHGVAGEFGQLPVGDKGFAPGRQQPGHLESLVGKDAVVARYRLQCGDATAGLDALLAALHRGDAAAFRTAAEWGAHLAKGLLQITNVLNPGLIILGGSVAPIFPFVSALVEDAMRRELIEGYPMPTIELSTLGPEGSALGGAALLHQKLFSVDESVLYPHARPVRLFAA
ncbi:MAG: ROK family transcriptional regulator [Rhizobiales bacterium]|nr:ROK family transcriptional regulator [Hyphomicrobiales bacterium]